MEKIRLDDLGAPRLPLPARLLNSYGDNVARRRVRLDPESLMAAARRRSGLADFGDDAFRPRLQLLSDTLENEADLSALGRLSTRGLLVQLLWTRLLLEELLRRHPEILEQPLEKPIVIAGLPRTGTTHLHNLLACHPSLRSLPYWESLEPIPASALSIPRATTAAAKPDPRIARCRGALRLLGYVMPHFAAMHEMTAEGPHEEIQLLAVDFASLLFDATYAVPSYGAWYKSADHTASYFYLRRILQVLQFLRPAGSGPRRWLLKSPQHLEQLGPLLAAFPDATVVQTHRDPVHITTSVCTMIVYTSRMQARRVDPRRIGRYWGGRVEDLLRASVEDRSAVPASQIVDLRFDEFLKDQTAAVERVLDFAGEPFTDAARSRVAAFLAANPRGKHGAVDYRPEDVGLDAVERRRALRFYQQRFAVPDED